MSLPILLYSPLKYTHIIMSDQQAAASLSRKRNRPLFLLSFDPCPNVVKAFRPHSLILRLLPNEPTNDVLYILQEECLTVVVVSVLLLLSHRAELLRLLWEDIIMLWGMTCDSMNPPATTTSPPSSYAPTLNIPHSQPMRRRRNVLRPSFAQICRKDNAAALCCCLPVKQQQQQRSRPRRLHRPFSQPPPPPSMLLLLLARRRPHLAHSGSVSPRRTEMAWQCVGHHFVLLYVSSLFGGGCADFSFCCCCCWLEAFSLFYFNDAGATPKKLLYSSIFLLCPCLGHTLAPF